MSWFALALAYGVVFGGIVLGVVLIWVDDWWHRRPSGSRKETPDA